MVVGNLFGSPSCVDVPGAHKKCLTPRDVQALSKLFAFESLTEFKKTDKSILVSPQGASRVAFNPEQKPPHGVLKSASGSPVETSQIKKPSLVPAKKRPTAMDFF